MLIRSLLAIVMLLASLSLAGFARAQETPLAIAKGSAEIEWTDADGTKTPGGLTGVYIGEDQVAHCEAMATDGTSQNLLATAAARAMLQAWFPFNPARVAPTCTVTRWVEDTKTVRGTAVDVPLP